MTKYYAREQHRCLWLAGLSSRGLLIRLGLYAADKQMRPLVWNQFSQKYCSILERLIIPQACTSSPSLFFLPSQLGPPRTLRYWWHFSAPPPIPHICCRFFFFYFTFWCLTKRWGNCGERVERHWKDQKSECERKRENWEVNGNKGLCGNIKMTKMKGKGKEGRGHKKETNLQQKTHREKIKKTHYGLLVYDLGVISSSLNRKELCWILDEKKID